MNISFDVTPLILEVKEDIIDYGAEYKCYLYYRKINDITFCTDYALVEDLDNKAFNVKEGEFRVESTLGKALEIFKSEDRIL